jgi:oligosaccharide repeat unit polymerase
MNQVIIHPLFIWSLSWGLVIFLNNRHYSDLLRPLSVIYYIIICSIFIMSLYIVVLMTIARNSIITPTQSSSPREDIDVNILLHFVSVVLILLLIGYAVEIILSGGIPVIWYLRGEDKTYFDFGIKGLHGFFNSLYFFATSGVFLYYLKTRNNKILFYFLLLLLIPIIFITRQGFIVVLLQSAILFFLNRKIKFRNMIILIGIILVNIILFGIIGALRTGTQTFMKLTLLSDNWPAWLPSGFAWVYMYVTTPSINFDNTIQIAQPGYNGFYLLSNLLPSPIRGMIYDTTDLVGELETSAFNVSSYLVEALRDFGIPGAVIFGILVFGLSYYIYLKAVRVRTIDYQLMYAILGQCMVISIFYNHFCSLPIVTQFLWIWIFRLYAQKKALAYTPCSIGIHERM